MKTQSHIEKVNEILESLDGIKRAEPRPYFYTRLTARLQQKEKTLWETIGYYLSKPVLVAICLSFVLVFNAFILFRQDADTESASSAPQAEQLMSDNEYVLASSSSFEYENLDQQ